VKSNIGSIEGKSILFLAPSFFGYELKIKTKMEEMGAIVDYYDERSVSTSIQKIFTQNTSLYFY
jgi:hypothetical protein